MADKLPAISTDHDSCPQTVGGAYERCVVSPIGAKDSRGGIKAGDSANDTPTVAQAAQTTFPWGKKLAAFQENLLESSRRVVIAYIRETRPPVEAQGAVESFLALDAGCPQNDLFPAALDRGGLQEAPVCTSAPIEK